MDGALSLSKKGICHSENEKSGGGLPIGVCEDMCLANTPYRRKITETRVFPLFFKSRGGTGGDRGSKASITSRRDPASPVQQRVDFVDTLRRRGYVRSAFLFPMTNPPGCRRYIPWPPIFPAARREFPSWFWTCCAAAQWRPDESGSAAC